MKIVREKTIRICIVAIAVLVAVVLYASWHVSFMQRRRATLHNWEQTARNTFRDVLKDEMRVRLENDESIWLSRGERVVSDTLLSIPISFHTPWGVDSVIYIPRYKWDNRLMEESQNQRLTFLLHGEPIQIDSLYAHWNQQMEAAGVHVLAQLRFIHSGFIWKDTMAYSGTDTLQLCLADSLFSYYVGGFRENEYTVFWRPQGRVETMQLADYVLLLLVVVVFSLCIYYNKVIASRIDGAFFHGHVVRADKNLIFRLGNKVVFDSVRKVIIKREGTISVSPNDAALLKAFLQKDDHALSYKEIDKLLWDGNSTKDGFRKQMSRFRKVVDQIPSYSLSCVNETYHLIIEDTGEVSLLAKIRHFLKKYPIRH